MPDLVRPLDHAVAHEREMQSCVGKCARVLSLAKIRDDGPSHSWLNPDNRADGRTEAAIRNVERTIDADSESELHETSQGLSDLLFVEHIPQ